MGNDSLKGILLVSDLDGTLIGNNGEIPERNKIAIERFTSKGGLFAFATGRSKGSAERYVRQVALNAPSIICNGPAIYDYQKECFVWGKYLPRQSIEVLSEVIACFPDVGVEIFSDERILILNKNELVRQHIEYEKLEVNITELCDVPANCNKMLFAAEHERLQEVADFLQARDHDGVEYVFSSLMYYEALPAGITKGYAVRVLADMLKIDHDKIMGIGDYNNDLELVRNAYIGAVPENALDVLKEASDLIVCDCAHGAVADFIEYIEKHFEN